MNQNKGNFWIATAVSGCTAVILGAFGAHGLKNLVSDAAIDIWQKGVDYQFYHTLALLFLISVMYESKFVKWAFYAFIIGIILFSGSLYILALKEVWHLTAIKWIGPITPLGGLFFIIGWICLFIHGVKPSK